MKNRSYQCEPGIRIWEYFYLLYLCGSKPPNPFTLGERTNQNIEKTNKDIFHARNAAQNAPNQCSLDIMEELFYLIYGNGYFPQINRLTSD
jgi:hypothetical protein